MRSHARCILWRVDRPWRLSTTWRLNSDSSVAALIASGNGREKNIYIYIHTFIYIIYIYHIYVYIYIHWFHHARRRQQVLVPGQVLVVAVDARRRDGQTLREGQAALASAERAASPKSNGWENHGKIMGKWENHRKIMGKPTMNEAFELGKSSHKWYKCGNSS